MRQSSAHTNTVCGIDLSSRRAGIALLSPLTDTVETHLVRNPQRDPSSVRGRQHFAHDVLDRVLRTLDEACGCQECPAIHVFVEGIIAVRNARTAIDAAYLAGAVETLLSHEGYVVHHINVSTWKRIALGNAKASKDEIGDWFRQTFSHEPPSQDEADAAGIAWCGASILARPVEAGSR